MRRTLTSLPCLAGALMVLLTCSPWGNALPIEVDNPEPISYQISPKFGDLDDIAERGILRILVTHSQTDFFFDQGRIRGIQYEMALAFLKHINEGRTNRFHASEANRIFPQFIPVAFAELIPALKAGRGDIAAAFLTMTPERQSAVNFVSPQGRDIAEVIVAHKDAEPIKRLADLSGRSVYVLRGSSYETHLHQLNKMLILNDLAPITIHEADPQLLTEDILELTNAGIIDYTVADDYKAELWQNVLPNIRLQRNARITEDQKVGWAIRKSSPLLEASLNEFTAEVKKGTYLGNLLFRRYFESTRWIDNPLSQQDRQNFDRLIALFTVFGEQYRFDPLALAAQSYQESRFDQTKRSHRGAVGVMQLLPSTARDPNVGIPDIDDLESNIHAGTKYLDFLRTRYFSAPEIDPANQRLFAWAAYNAGPASIARTRKAAEESGLNPNVWFGNVETMAAKMISREPVRYVASIYKYYTAYRLMERQNRERKAALEAVLDES